MNGRVFVKDQTRTTEVTGRTINSLTVNKNGIYGIDKDDNLVKRIGVSGSFPYGTSWKIIDSNRNYKNIYNAPNGDIISK